AATLGGTLVVACGLATRTRPRGTIITTVIAMLALQALGIRGYVDSPQGRSVMKPLADAVLAQYPDALAYNAAPNDRRPPTDLGVYLNRIIRWMPEPSRIEPADRPQVLFMLQEKST